MLLLFHLFHPLTLLYSLYPLSSSFILFFLLLLLQEQTKKFSLQLQDPLDNELQLIPVISQEHHSTLGFPQSWGYKEDIVFCQKKAIEGSTNVFDWSDFFHSLLLHKTSLLLEIHWDCPQCLLVMDREEVLSLGGDGLEDELGVS